MHQAWGDVVQYRLYRTEDFAQLYAIEEECFQPPDRFGRRYMERLINTVDSATWIAEEEGHLAGFAIAEWSNEAEPDAAYIQTIEVSAAFRRRGVGAELLQRIELSAQTAGATLIWLHVDARNDAAIRLYGGQGYMKQGTEQHYYGRGRAADIYCKLLEPPQAVLQN